MNCPNIFNIQRFSLHDGDGIRTTVFFKGCPLDCAWCHNPESRRYKSEVLYNSEKCTMCAACIDACPQEAISIKGDGMAVDASKCDGCLKCADACKNGARETAGFKMPVRELSKELARDLMFYEDSDGGITFSGGEAMAQDMEYMEELLKSLKKAGLDVAIDTCGHVPYERFERVMPYTDMFLYDLKIVDSEKHMKYTGADNALILENLKKLSRDRARIALRMPLIDGVNTSDEDIENAICFLKSENIYPHQVNLIPYHNIGAYKYERLGEDYRGDGFSTPDSEKLESIKARFEENGFLNTKIGG